MRLLAKNPSERPESATDVLSALEAIDLVDVGAIRESPLQDDPHALDSLAGGVFVGRQREMGELKACLEDALSGRGRLVTLVGEPGIGKTRTAQELATYAGLRGAQVLWGRCYEGEGAPPYWPWVQAIRSYVRDVDPEQLRSDMGAGAADIGQVVSDVGDRLPGLEAPPQLEPEQARFRLFDSITTFLKSAGRRQPLVLVLDDLHWADHPSMLLLEFVARELSNARLLIIGTYRDVELSRQHPLSKSLGELTRERLFQRVLLRGLDQEDVGRFIELASGITPPPGMVEAVHRQTEGNPLFVTEVVRLLVQEGELTQEKAGERDSWSVRIPQGVRDVIGRRLDRLSERCNETLTIASVVGREFTLEQLSPLIEDPSSVEGGSGQAITEGRLLDVLDEALSARVIEELPRAVGRYQFTHALIQETLAEELPTARRVLMHARIGEALELLYGADAEAHAAELAHHFAEAQTVLATEKLVRYSLLAGERALSGVAYEEALAYFEPALAVKESQPIDTETAALLFGLGRALAALSDYPAAIKTLSTAFDHYREVGDTAKSVAVAQYPWPPLPAVLQGVPELIAKALTLVPLDSSDAAGLLPPYGTALYLQNGDYEGAQTAFQRAIDLARSQGNRLLETRTLVAAAGVDFYHAQFAAGAERGLRAFDIAREEDNVLGIAAGSWLAGLCLSALGELEQAEECASAGLEPAERLRDRTWLGRVCLTNHFVCFYRGDFSAAREYAERGLAVVPEDSRLLFVSAVRECETGNLDDANAYLERTIAGLAKAPSAAATEYANTAWAVAAVVTISGDTRHLDAGERAAQKVVSSPEAPAFYRCIARLALGRLAAMRGDAKAAADQYRELGDWVRGLFPVVTSGDRLLGQLAHTMGNMDQATEHFEDALAFCRKGGYRPELAWTCCDYADMLLERNIQGDRAKANALLDESLAISSELGMRPLLERVLSGRGILGA